MVDRVADAINTIKTHEHVGREECVLYSTGLIRAILDVMKRESYVKGYEEFTEGRARKARVTLSNKINDIGIIKPRYAVTAGEIQGYEQQYIPSKDFGILILSTSQGLMTNREARQKGIGGRLIAYMY